MRSTFRNRLLSLLFAGAVLLGGCAPGAGPPERSSASPTSAPVAAQEPTADTREPSTDGGTAVEAEQPTQPSGTAVAGQGQGAAKLTSGLPAVPKRVPASSYAYDDMSKKYDIEFMLAGAFNGPLPADDPVKRYLDKQLNVNAKLTSLTGDDLRNTVATRFVSGKPPDVIVMPFRDVALSLYEQGQLAEVSKLLPLMPQASQYATADYKKWATVDGEMIGIPRYAIFPDNGGLFIRSDFLENLGMSAPTTEDELFAYAQAVTTKDPDKDGKADSWFMATGGGGTGWGMIEILQSMYGHPSWNVADGKINHPMLDGSRRRYLQFVKKLNDNKVLAPDWYTTEWEQLKSRTFNDQLGMVTYPGWNLIDETYNAKKRDLKAVEVWEALEPPKANDGKGGNYPPGGAPGGLFLISKQAAEDEGKLNRIAHMLDTLIYPNENYWEHSQGGGPKAVPGGSRVVFNEEDGTNVFYIDKEKHPAYTDQKYSSVPDWQFIGYTLLYQVYDDPVGEVGTQANQAMQAMPRYKNNDVFLNLDGPTVSKITDFQNQNEIQFVLGKRSFDQWDSYVEQWKRTGGQKLIDQAAEQLGAAK